MRLFKDMKFEKFYPINLQWLSNYLQYNNLNYLYNDQIINKTLENIIINSNEDLSNEIIIENAKLQKEFTNILYNYLNNIPKNQYSSEIPICPTKIKISDIFYYKNFILFSEDTMKSFFNNNIQKQLYFYCYLGDNKIFVTNNGPKIFLIEVYYLNSNNIIPEIFYKFNGKNELSSSLHLLLDKGFSQYTKYYLMFNDDNNMDYTSPIFNQNNQEIGYAYKFNPNISDYFPYIINNEYKTAIKLYFYYIKFQSKSIMYKTGNDYYLINNELITKIKEHYDYLTLEKYLSQNKISQ